MKRALAVWFPMLPIDALRRSERRSAGPGSPSPDERPLLLAAKVGQRRVVMARCERARAMGVRIGMAVADACAIMPAGTARIEEHRPERDRAVLRGLAVWAHRFSPIVATDEPDGLFLDAGGCAEVFGGEERHVRLLLRALAALGFRARAAMAPTFACAWAVTRYQSSRLCHRSPPLWAETCADVQGRSAQVGLKAGRPVAHQSGIHGLIIPEGESRRAIEPLPVRALRLDDATVAGLREVGVERVGQLIALPRSSLPARFGAEILLRLDQALGAAMEPINPVRPVEPLRVERVFDGPTTQWEAIAITVRRLLREMGARLRAKESGARKLDLILGRSDLPPAALSLGLSRASRDERHLWSLIRPRLERMHLGYGVEKITLGAPWTGRVRHEQKECWRDEARDAETERAAAELVDTLANRFGAERVAGAELVGSHIPERAYAMRAWDAAEAFSRRSPLKRADEVRGCSPAGRVTLEAGALTLRPGGPTSLRFHPSDARPPSGREDQRQRRESLPLTRGLLAKPRGAPGNDRSALRAEGADPEADAAQIASAPWVPKPPKAKQPPSAASRPPGFSDRPALLLARGEPVRTMSLTPDGPVMSVHWRGEDLRIGACIGPERIGAEWWTESRVPRCRGVGVSSERPREDAYARTRDYFKAQDQHGRWLWLAREIAGDETRRWFVQGVWA